MPNLRNGSKGGFEPGLPRLRVRHSTTELLRSTFEPGLSRLLVRHFTSIQLDRSQRFTCQTCSFRHQLDFPGKHSVPAITRENYSITFPLLSISRHSFIQLSELGRCGENKNGQTSKRQQRRFEPGLSRLLVRHFTAELPR